MRLPADLTPEAEADVEDAARWYEQRSAGLGAELVGRVREALDRITQNPDLYPEIHHGVRRAPVRRFRLEVIAVFHDRRDPSAWQSRV